MLIEILLFFIFAIFSFIFYNWCNIDQLYYERRGIKYQTLSFELGNLFGIILNRFTCEEFAKRIYQAFPNETLYGAIGFGKPQYVVKDAELIKKIAIKDFDYFEDHLGFADEKIDKLWGNSLFMMKGQKWRQMRATLSPAFTGSKMRLMYELISECVEDVIRHHKEKCDAETKSNVEMKDLFTRYTSDVIASCAFGFRVDSFTEPNNEFYLNGKKLTNFATLSQTLKMIIMLTMPKLARILNIQLADSGKFRSMVLDMMDYRKKNNIHRPDMINIMMQIRDGNLKHESEAKSKNSEEGFATVEESEVGKATVNQVWNDDEVVAQCFLFFIAGFETTSTMLVFAAYELVANPEIQQKLYEEITEANEQLDGKKISYDFLQKLKYLDKFVSEVLRKWPPFIQPNRKCVKNYSFDDGAKLKFDVEKDSVVHIPIYGIHHDPKYYPEPEKFDPERFSDENKGNIIFGTYLPFGIGPRNCIGSRFALMEIKALLYHMLLNFSFEPNGKTDLPFKLKKTPFSLVMKNGMHLELKSRS